VDRRAQVHEVGLVCVLPAVAVDHDGDCLGRLSRDEGDRPGSGNVVVAVRRGRAVGGSVIHGDGHAAGGREAHGEDGGRAWRSLRKAEANSGNTYVSRRPSLGMVAAAGGPWQGGGETTLLDDLCPALVPKPVRYVC